MPPWATDYEFTAHVGIAILCVFVALAIVLVLPFVSDAEERRQRKSRKFWKE